MILNVDITWFAHGHHMVSTWTPHGFHIDTTWLPHGHHMFFRNPHGNQHKKQLCMKPTGSLVYLCFKNYLLKDNHYKSLMYFLISSKSCRFFLTSFRMSQLIQSNKVFRMFLNFVNRLFHKHTKLAMLALLPTLSSHKFAVLIFICISC